MLDEERLEKSSTLARLPPEWQLDLLPAIREQVDASGRKVVVLDDDPTGTQTVHDIPVLTGWSADSLRDELLSDQPCFYVLTNSRSFAATRASAINQEIGKNLVAAAQGSERGFVAVSRSDSTLRGHFPGEVEALATAIGTQFDAWLIAPFFLEGGRYTINDIHYVAEDEWLVPAAATPFAQDTAFGYRASNLREWVAEKTAGRVAANTVASISIEDLRQGGPEQVARILRGLTNAAVCVVNIASYRDMEVFVAGLLGAEADGKRFLYRTAASFVRVRAGLAPRPVLTKQEMGLREHGGALFVIGSHVPKTTMQLEALLATPGLTHIEISVPALLDDNRQTAEIDRVAATANAALGRDEDVVVYTSRDVVAGADSASSLAIGQRVSAALVAAVRAIVNRPRYIVAKGGITSSDLATRALDVERAVVMGQILPGVPVWALGPTSRHPGVPYIVFPGNVGGPQALVEVAEKLQA
jgi:uncharacterized protein YgbK (DUF1537 family)